MVLRVILNLIFPAKCIFCGSLLSLNTKVEVCGKCYEAIPFVGEGFIGKQANHVNRSGCDYIVCVCRYTGIVKEALIRYKFFGKSGYHRVFAKLLVEKIKEMTNYREFDIIISVPLHKQRQEIRGYNQSLLISKMLSRQLRLPEKSGLIVRIKNTHSQSRLNKAERYVNIRDAFKVSNHYGIEGKTVLLVDDVTTTGYTLEECSRVLKEAGAVKVIGAVIASGRGC